MPAVKGKPGLTATMWALLVIFGLLVIVGVVFWMMTTEGGGYKAGRSRFMPQQVYALTVPVSAP